MSDERPTQPQRRTVVIGEAAVDAAPGTGATIDPLVVPIPEDSRSHTRGTTKAMRRPGGTGSSTSATTLLDTPIPDSDATIPDGTSGTRVVVIGGDDDLPDASYTAQPSRSPDDVRGPRVHPRMKARRLAVRRDAGRRRLYVTAVLGAIVLIGIAAVGVLSTPLFAISTVRVNGLVYTDQEALSAITKSLRGKPILTADLNAVRDRVEALPWVKYATVAMDFPHTVVVQIAERTPMAAYLGDDNQWRVIDVEGRVIDVLEGQPVDYTAIIGAGPALKPGETATEYAKVAQLVSAIPPTLAPMVKVFEVDQQYNVSMTLAINDKGDTQVDLCAATDLDVLQIVSLTAFINTKVNPDSTPPGRIAACKADLITTSAS